MHLICLCATFGRPSLVANAVALFERQELRAGDTAHLLIFDDSGCLAAQSQYQSDRSWLVTESHTWRPLCEKYQTMIAANACHLGSTDAAFVVWDDDDFYSPWHLAAHATALECRPWSHPSIAHSTHQVDVLAGELPREKRLNARNYHGAVAIRGDLMQTLRGWPITERSDFDRQMLANCWATAGAPADPCATHPPSYVYRWRDTGHDHYSARIRDGRCQPPRIEEPGRVEQLVPTLDAVSRALRNDWLPTPASPAS